MVIDAGQKKIGAQHCVTCDFVYSDDPSEQKAHDIRHSRALGYIDFKGWKKENKIDCPDLDGRVVMVKYHDANNHWDKVFKNFFFEIIVLNSTCYCPIKLLIHCCLIEFDFRF